MSTTARHLRTPPAPWKAPFEDDVKAMDSPEFVLSTVQAASSSSSGLPWLPRARYCIYRGMWAELPPNKHNEEPRNPEAAFGSECPTFTTDVRMHKIGDLFASGAGRAESEAQMQGSGGGGPVEAVWWCKDRGRQWRVKGTAWVVAADVEESGGDGQGAQGSSGVRSLKSEIGQRMRIGDEEKAKEWSWGRELQGHFGNLSPGMRGSFKNPPPGSKMNGQPDKDHQLGQKVDAQDKLAFSNFRVVIVKPDEVEKVDLNDPEKALRHRYTFVEKDGEGNWTEEELWP